LDPPPNICDRLLRLCALDRLHRSISKNPIPTIVTALSFFNCFHLIALFRHTSIGSAWIGRLRLASAAVLVHLGSRNASPSRVWQSARERQRKRSAGKALPSSISLTNHRYGESLLHSGESAVRKAVEKRR
jgi:hypothetical protein